MLITEYLDLENLINIARINKHFADLAFDSFRHKYSNQEIDFRDSFTYRDREGQSPVKYLNRIIQVNGEKMCDKTIANFGPAIRKIRLTSFQKSKKSIGKFMKSINECCAKSLHELKLWDLESDALAQLTNPFEQVDTLLFSLNMQNETLANGTLPLNRLFPRVHHFTLIVGRDVDAAYIDCELPHLKHLAISFTPNPTEVTANQIEPLIRKNPHIRSLDLNNFGKELGKFLENTSQLLPQLENLTLEDTAFGRPSTRGNKSIRWENVKVLDFRSGCPPDRIVLPKLQELHITQYKYGVYEFQCTRFFQIHTNIQRLFIKNSLRPVEHMTLSELTMSLSKLTQVFITNAPAFAVDDIIQFIRTHENLTKLRLDRIDKLTRFTLRTAFEKEWYIDKYNIQGIFMRRKF